VPEPFPLEFRRDVVAVARRREAPMSRIAKDFGISESCLHRWLKLADVEDGLRGSSLRRAPARPWSSGSRPRRTEELLRDVCRARAGCSPASHNPALGGGWCARDSRAC